MRDRSSSRGGESERSIRNGKRHRRSYEGRGIRRTKDADAGSGPATGSSGPDVDGRAKETMRDVGWHLRMAEERERENHGHRLQEAGRISRDLSAGTPSKAVAHDRTQEVDDLLQRAESTENPDADGHIDAARQAVRDLLWRLKP
ncbi:hypothetical protein [Halorientalis halophila]|uniref:hypothetical protein n=1 Tax=Halorientalis halophila TaxID=3108499 RepID=UPI00300A21F7